MFSGYLIAFKKSTNGKTPVNPATLEDHLKKPAHLVKGGIHDMALQDP